MEEISQKTKQNCPKKKKRKTCPRIERRGKVKNLKISSFIYNTQNNHGKIASKGKKN